MTSSPRRRRWPWIVLAFVVAIPLAGFLALRAFVNPESLRPRLVAAVEGATGRRFTVGEIGLALSLRPTIVLRDVALANAEGGSRPEMLTARRVEVEAALLPLLSRRVEISRIEFDGPDLLLETDAEGHANWQFRRPAAPAQPGSPSQPAAPAQPLALGVDRLRIEAGRVTWRDTRAGTAETVEIPALDAAAPLAGPTTARGTLRLRGQDIALEATGGALAAFGGAAPFPFDAKLGVAGAEARVRGTLTGSAWTAAIEAGAPTLAALAPLLPDAPLPPLRDVFVSGNLAGTGRAVSGAEALILRVGASDLSVLRPGLALSRLEVTAPRLDAPVTLAGEAAIGGAPIRLTGTAGTPAILLGRAPGPWPVDLRVEAAGAGATLRGAVQDARAMAGVDLALAAEVPDLAALSPLAGTKLPAIRDLRAATRIAERTPGFAGGALLRDLVVTSAPAEARGELTLIIGERPGVAGRLDVARLDLDAIRAAMPAAPPAAAPAAPPAAAPAPAADGRVIPDLPLPVGALRTFDADLRLAIAALIAGGAAWRDISLPVKLEAGQGRIAPFSAVTPGGPLSGELAADAAATTPSLHLVLRAPGLDLAALQQAFGQPVRVSGHGEIEADLRGSGSGLRAVAASLAGHLGLAMLDATLEPPVTAPVQAALRERVPVLPPLPARLPVDCVALRAEAAEGVLRIGTLLLNSPAAKVAGSGTVNLGTEAIAMRLLHDIRAAGTTVRIAADLGGTLVSPAYGGVRADNLGELLGGLAGRVGGDAGAILGALTNRGGTRAEPLPDCGPALAAARGGREGRVPAASAAAAPAAPVPAPAIPGVPPQLQGPAGDLLRGLLRR